MLWYMWNRSLGSVSSRDVRVDQSSSLVMPRCKSFRARCTQRKTPWAFQVRVFISHFSERWPCALRSDLEETTILLQKVPRILADVSFVQVLQPELSGAGSKFELEFTLWMTG